jgi:threonine/homoserine/homoserine lactone efflux protein
MSLKHFHLVFLFFAILMDAGFFLWTRLAPEAAARAGATVLGMVAGLICLLLLAYGGCYLLKKSRTIIVD